MKAFAPRPNKAAHIADILDLMGKIRRHDLNGFRAVYDKLIECLKVVKKSQA